MTADSIHPLVRSCPWTGFLVLAAATVVAAVSARPYAGGWNDGSRLATVEALVDHHTLAIDDSIFVKVPAAGNGAAPSPYPRDDAVLMKKGTLDKLYIRGHYYSDKSPVPALLMAGIYQGWQWLTGLTARDHADRFCYGMILLTSGLAYVVAVWCIFRTAGLVGLTPVLSLALTASFALATVALPYARQVNNHIVLLGITAALVLGLVRLAGAGGTRRSLTPAVLGLGTLAGLGYTVDLGAGPVFLACTLGAVVYRGRRWQPAALFLLAAVPWLALHHVVNYAVGGTWQPANAVAGYFRWPGCPFQADNLTGGWHHHGVGPFLTYAAGLLVDKKGFLGHNPALFLALPVLVVLLWRRTPELPEVLFTGFCCGGVWLAYAVTSTNASGSCCTIRWFVPLLAPAYLVLALGLRRFPDRQGDFLVLSAWGAVIAGLAWWEGPWMKHMVPCYWPLQAATLLSWLGYCAWKRHQKAAAGRPTAMATGPRAKAA
jgi:hypothetical protein